MPSSFTNTKELKFVITLGVGTFGSSQDNQITLQGFRAYVDVDLPGGAASGTLQAKIYGVSLSHMNSITTLFFRPVEQLYNTPNLITVYAVDGDSETLVFQGNILQAWGEFRGMPDVYLHIQAQAGYFDQLKAVSPRGFKGPIDVAVIMKQIADALGLRFENNGVSFPVVDQYVANTAIEQAKELAEAAGCEIYFDYTGSTLAIANRGTPRSSPSIPLISKDTGLKGYPTFDSSGVVFYMLYSPEVKWGSTVQLQSDIQQACGQWKVMSLTYRLESERPGGEWYIIVRGSPLAIAPF